MFFVYRNDEIAPFFKENWEPGAQPKLTHAYYVSLVERLNVTPNPKRRNYKSRLRGGVGKELLSIDSRVAFAYCN